MKTPHYAVRTVTPAASDPVSLSEAKLYAKIDTDADDTLISQLINTATISAERYTRRSFVTRTLMMTVDGLPSGIDLPAGVYQAPISILSGGLPEGIKLPHGPVQAVSLVTTYDLYDAATAFASSNYRVDFPNNRLLLKYGAIWPSNLRNQGCLEVTYTAGYGDASAVPNPIKTAILMHVQKMYDERIVCDVPDNCMQLLQQYRTYG